ncbi:hypothetical protein CRV24_008538 [Beauveria bassiana]|nr:hypothetical protein CRV24_008538 [Beauveria bassiana]
MRLCYSLPCCRRRACRCYPWRYQLYYSAFSPTRNRERFPPACRWVPRAWLAACRWVPWAWQRRAHIWSPRNGVQSLFSLGFFATDLFFRKARNLAQRLIFSTCPLVNSFCMHGLYSIVSQVAP